MMNLVNSLNDNFIYIWVPSVILVILFDISVDKFKLYGKFADYLLRADYVFVIVYLITKIITMIVAHSSYLITLARNHTSVVVFIIIVIIQVVFVLFSITKRQ